MRYFSNDQRRSSSMVQLSVGEPEDGGAIFWAVPMPLPQMEDEEVVAVEKDSSIVRTCSKLC